MSIAVSPDCPEAWLAGYSCGSVALFKEARSRPALLWQQLRNAPVLALRWGGGLDDGQLQVALCSSCLLGVMLLLSSQAPTMLSVTNQAIANT